jgi:biofilm PGA synthesis N-glycosyltransferase PgaC
VRWRAGRPPPPEPSRTASDGGREAAYRESVEPADRLRLAVAVLFLNEERLLPRMLASLSTQTRPPERLLLVDDGSSDDSPAMAAAFTEQHLWARGVSRPRQVRTADRLARAAELTAFQWAVDHERLADGGYDVIAKLDADLELPADFFARIMAEFESNPRLGIGGAPLAVAADGGDAVPEYSQPWHVRGATKFYRLQCWQQVAPLPPILGWDTIDETRARMHGWEVRTVAFSEPALHLRPTGSYDGALRGFHRRGVAAWGYGAHPVNVIASATVRMRQRPRVVGGFAYLAGWAQALIRRAPRADRDTRRHLRHEQLQRLRRAIVRTARV